MNHSPKVLKKDIKRLWKSISKDIESGIIPDLDMCTDLVKKCDNYTLFAKSEWAEQWKECCDKIKLCHATAKDSNFAASSTLLKEINEMKKECHVKFKK